MQDDKAIDSEKESSGKEYRETIGNMKKKCHIRVEISENNRIWKLRASKISYYPIMPSKNE